MSTHHQALLTIHTFLHLRTERLSGDAISCQEQYSFLMAELSSWLTEPKVHASRLYVLKEAKLQASGESPPRNLTE